MKNLDKLPIGVHPVAGQRGLRFVVGKGGTRSWSWRRREGDRLVQTALGQWPKVSMQAAIETIQKLKLGIVEPTVGDVMKGYIQHLRRVRTGSRAVQMLEKHVGALWKEKASGVTRQTAAQLIATLRDRPATAHMLRGELTRAWEHAGLDANPWTGVKTRPNPPRSRVLTETELLRWFSWLRESKLSLSMQEVLMLMLATGMRGCEVIAMEWGSIDWQGGTYLLGTSKNGDGRTVYLGSWALEVLRERRERLFGEPRTTGIEESARNIAGSTEHMTLAYEKNTMDSATTRKDENTMDFVTSLAKTSIGPHVTNSRGAYDQRTIQHRTTQPTNDVYVFASRDGKHMLQPRLVNAICRVKSTCPVQSWTAHDVRRSARTHWARLGIPDHLAELMLGHRPTGILAVYNRWKYEDEQRAAMQVWDRYLQEMLPLK